MKITVRKSKQRYTDEIHRSVDSAKKWIRNQYGKDVNLDNVDFIFGGGCRSRYFRNEDNSNPKYPNPTIFICCRGKWATYKMKSLKLYADWVFIGVERQILLSLIHELTHHVQHELGMPKGEKETTKNELLYCEWNYRKVYKQLTTI